MESRDVPAQFRVTLLSPAQGASQNTQATVSSTLATNNIVVEANTPAEAAEQALVGVVGINAGGQTANYDPGTPGGGGGVGTSPSEQEAFLLTPEGDTYRIGLEDLTMIPGVPPDWDYNDVIWYIDIQPIIVDVPTPVPGDWWNGAWWPGLPPEPIQNPGPGPVIQVPPPQGWSFSPYTPGPTSPPPPTRQIKDSPPDVPPIKVIPPIFGPTPTPIPTTPPPEPSGSISGKAWTDDAHLIGGVVISPDGIRQPTEATRSGVVVYLFAGSSSTYSGMTVTNEYGLYEFTNLPLGSYTVAFQPVGPFGDWSFTKFFQGNDRSIDSDVLQTTALTAFTPAITLTSSAPNRLNIDAGIIQKASTMPVPPGPLGSISGTVWDDSADGDGIMETGEPRLAGRRVLLWSDRDQRFIKKTTTNNLGKYVFNVLGIENYYQVAFERGDEWNFTIYHATGSSNSTDSDVANFDDSRYGWTTPLKIYRNGNQVVNLVDIGSGEICSYPTGPGLIEGTVWSDETRNNLQDTGDTPEEGMMVRLYTTDGTFLRATSTDQGGYYQFPNLPLAAYVIKMDPWALRTFVVEDYGNNDLTDSDVDAAGWSKPVIVQTPGYRGNPSADVDAGVFLAAPPRENNKDYDVVILTPGAMNGNKPAAEARIAKWEAAFKNGKEEDERNRDGDLIVGKPRPILTTPDKNGLDFIDYDTDRFVVMVKDKARWANQDSILAYIRTENDNEDYADNETQISLVKMKDKGMNGWFISDTNILVSNTIDDTFEKGMKIDYISVDNSAGGGEVTKSKRKLITIDRTHIAALDGKLKIRYEYLLPDTRIEDSIYAEAPIKPRYEVKLHINNVTAKATGIASATTAQMTEHIRLLREIYAQVGIMLITPSIDAALNTDKKYGGVIDDGKITEGTGDSYLPPAPQQPRLVYVPSNEEKLLIGEPLLRTPPNNGKEDDIEVYYVPDTSNDLQGYSMWASFLSPLDQKFANSVIVAAKYIAPRKDDGFALAHEIMHCLENIVVILGPLGPVGGPNPTHHPYVGKQEPRHRVNLMIDGGDAISINNPIRLNEPSPSIFDSRRLTESQESRVAKNNCDAVKKL